MKTKKESKNWLELLQDKISEMTMIRLRGGDGGEEDPGEPIIKGP